MILCDEWEEKLEQEFKDQKFFDHHEAGIDEAMSDLRQDPKNWIKKAREEKEL